MSNNHGNTPAAWTAVAVAMLGFVVGSIALLLTPINLTMLYVGLVLGAIALPVFLILGKIGLNGSPSGSHTDSHTDSHADSPTGSRH